MDAEGEEYVAKLRTLLLWAGRGDPRVYERIQGGDPAIQTREIAEMATELDEADEKRITTTLYGSAAAKF